MIEIEQITSSCIKLKGVGLQDEEAVTKIMDICHEMKHLYSEGFPYGRKTRRKNKQRLEKWEFCPEICFVYLVVGSDSNVTIRVLTSDIEKLLEKYTQDEINYHTQMYIQGVADKIIKSIN